MFCERCGTQLPDTAEFCTNCGTSIARGERIPTYEKKTDTEIQLRVQPSFKLGYMILPTLIIYGIMSLIFSFAIMADKLGVFLVCLVILVIMDETRLRVQPSFKFGYMILRTLIICGIMYGIMILIFSPKSDVTMDAVLVVFLVGFVILAIILGIKTALNKKQYDNFCYDFYKTKVIYKDSFLNLSEKEVKYKYIREVTMSQTFIQRYFNIGNIILFTSAETGYGNGIYIMNVENVQDVYRDIKSIIDV